MVIKGLEANKNRFLCLATLLSLLVMLQIAHVQAAPPHQTPVQSQKQRIIPTDNWAVELAPNVDPALVANRYGFIDLGQIGTLENYYLFRKPAGSTKADPSQLRLASEVKWLEQQVARQQFKRIVPTDPLFSAQWHLNNTGQSGGTVGEDINIFPVWNSNIAGSGVVIAVVDDGLQHTHPDITLNYLASASYDFNANDSDPSPTSATDGHGTSAAGVAAARDNSTCGVGAAFRANLAGLRLIAAPSTDAQEAAALTYLYNTNDIYSNSWGPTDDGSDLGEVGTLVQAAFLDGVTNGRNGLGNIYVWAAGNGLQFNDNVNYDGYANSRYTVAVGAVDNTGQQAWYSEPGAAMLVTAPSNGDGSGSLVGITTTDLLGADGYANDDCTSSFGGTSSATPLVSGIIALMLEANPSLTWRDVQHILVDTAVKNDPSDSGWSTNSAGHPVNHKYGFGRVDAEAAVNAAATWSTVDAVSTLDSSIISVNQSIPDNNAAGITVNIDVGSNINLEHVELIFDATHTNRGDLEVILTSPSGTQSVLAEPHADSNNNYNYWRFMSTRHWGELSQGTWSLKVADKVVANTGTFDSWQLRLYGTPAGPEPLLSSLPNQTLTVNSSLNNAIDLWAYATDDSDTDDQLSFAIDNTPDPNAGVSIDSNRYIDLNPAPDWIGQTDVTIRVTDTGNQSGTNSFQVIVNGGMVYLPFLIKSPPPPNTLVAVADTDILQGYPNGNSCSLIEMWAGYDDLLNPDGKIARSLIKFDLSQIPPGTPISHAVLNVRHFDSWDFPSASRTITVYRTASAWSSCAVTWNTRPSIAEAHGSQSIPWDAGSWYAFDVTNLVRGWINGSYPNYGLWLRGPENAGSDSAWRSFYTSNSSFSPYLSISYSSITGTSSPAIIDQERVETGSANSRSKQLGTSFNQSQQCPTEGESQQKCLGR